VNWATSYRAISETEGEITITAIIDNGWHTYSQKPTNDGPIPISFTFAPAKQYQLNGKTEESAPVEEFDQAFGAKVLSFSGRAVFKQKVKLAAKPGFTINFKVEYMCCDNKMCLPPKTVDLNVKVQ
jgi:hypothetical protein